MCEYEFVAVAINDVKSFDGSAIAPRARCCGEWVG